jgi:hypothetical protein
MEVYEAGRMVGRFRDSRALQPGDRRRPCPFL